MRGTSYALSAATRCGRRRTCPLLLEDLARDAAGHLDAGDLVAAERELRALIKAAEAAESKTLTVVADTADEPVS